MNKFQRDVLVGCLLGDGNLHTNTGRTWRLRLLHSSKQTDYLEHLYGVFKDFCKTGPIKQSFFDKRTQKNYYRIYFNSVYTDRFNFYGLHFYKKVFISDEDYAKKTNTCSKQLLSENSVQTDFRSLERSSSMCPSFKYIKKIPKNIYKFLTARALAYWYMDDGSLKWKNKSKTFVFCTDSFLKSEVLLLKDSLERNFGLKVSLQRKSVKNEQFRLYISSESAVAFKSWISPYIHPSMLYKINA